jgi:drug/metabolite transporter (DMT)-like permease
MNNSATSLPKKPLFYFLICSVIWGITWIAIKYQIHSINGSAAVFYRFFCASLIMFALCFYNKENLNFNKSFHFRFISQGFFMFCLNFILTYWATSMASSALVALAFTSLIFFNMFGARIFFNTPFEKKVTYGAIISFLGMALITLNEYEHIAALPLSVWGFLLSVLATLSASAGNLISTNNRRLKIPILANNAWGMFYGSAFTLIFCLFMHKDLSITWSWPFAISFFYLAVFGTVISFWSYLKLIDIVGPTKAAFTSVLSPVIALGVSTVFENFQWSFILFFGVALSITGNIIALVKLKKLN